MMTSPWKKRQATEWEVTWGDPDWEEAERFPTRQDAIAFLNGLSDANRMLWKILASWYEDSYGTVDYKTTREERTWILLTEE